MQKNISILFLSILLIFLHSNIYSQCEIKAHAASTTICAGDTIPIYAVGTCGLQLSNNFNNGTIGSNLTTSAAPMFNNPCGASIDSTIYLWMGSNSNAPRSITTSSLSITGTSCQICFDMKYGVNGQTSPCEGPDAANEGVHLQYSKNGGVSWTDIQYWNPNGGNDTNLTKWKNYCVMIPSAAYSTNIKFRWVQTSSNPANSAHWGLDNIKIFCSVYTNVTWAHGPTGLNPPDVFPNNTTTYTVTITDIFSGLFATDSVTINVKPRPNAYFSVVSPVCKGDNSTLTYTGSGIPTATYNWDFAGGNVVSGTGQGPYQVNWPNTGNYNVNLSVTQNGCTSNTEYIEILVAPLISFFIDTTSGCEPISIKIIDNTTPIGQIYLWDFGDGNTSTLQNPSHTYTSAGTYGINLTVTTSAGCTNSYFIPNLIKVFSSSTADFEAIPSIAPLSNPKIIFKNKSKLSTQWNWDFGDGTTSSLQSPSHTYINDGTYIVSLIVTSVNGCSDSISKEIRIIDDHLTIPNVFTPNGDGFNDFYAIGNIESLIKCELYVYNRWGNLVFESKNYDNKWEAKNLSEGVYFFILKYESYFDEKQVHGTITILR